MRGKFERSILSTTLTLCTGVALGLAPVSSAHAGSASAGPSSPEGHKLARGEYLTRVMGCNDCHTPFVMGAKGPEPNMSRMLSGHPADLVLPPAPRLGDGPWAFVGSASNTAYAGPWGVSYATNLTPDKETGLGSWTEATFVQALRTGRHEGQGRPILPPMPWPAYSQATDADLKAIFAYLQSVPAIHNRVPQAVEPSGAK